MEPKIIEFDLHPQDYISISHKLSFLDALACLGSMLENESVSDSFMFLRFGQILGISSEYVQGMFRVGSECVQSVFRVCSECVYIMIVVKIVVIA